MTALRRRIRVVAFAWLLCQAASLCAFVPGECCKAHAAEAAAKKQAPCHESASATATADRAVTPKDGDACPMHHGKKTHKCCTISNSCNGPGQQLTTLFAYVGVLESPQSAPIDLDSTVAFTPSSTPLVFQLSIPDSPPPKV